MKKNQPLDGFIISFMMQSDCNCIFGFMQSQPKCIENFPSNLNSIIAAYTSMLNASGLLFSFRRTEPIMLIEQMKIFVEK